MATYYTLTCDEHRECCEAFSRTGSPLGDSLETLTTFMWAHCECDTKLVWDNNGDDKLYKGSPWLK